MKAGWEMPDNKSPDKKTGEDIPPKRLQSSPFSPPCDPFGPNSDVEEKQNQEKDDYQYAVYLDMDLNGRPQKAEAQKRIREMVEKEEETEQCPNKKDRTAYWKKRYLKEKQIKTLRQTPHFDLCQRFVQDYFCGVRNIDVTMKKGPHGMLFKRAVIPNSKGTVQHDLIVSYGEGCFFHQITNDQGVQILPSENGTITLDNDKEIDADLIFAETYPAGVFPNIFPT